MTGKNQTIVALSTPSAESAVALIRLSGDKCFGLAGACFAKDPASLKPRHAYFSKYTALSGDELDGAVFTLYKAPHSYTGEDMLEISCHGNMFIIQNIIADLIARGARAAVGGEFTRRAFSNDKMDLSQAEAVSLIIGARSARALKAAQRQLDGELGRRIGQYSQNLLDICALVEAYIDFPEEEIPQESSDALAAKIRALKTQTKSLAQTSKYSALIHNGINVVIAGAPNAGKSSLLNALLGSRRAIVTSTAGTTRDYICEKTVFKDYCINLTDTAGLRSSENEIESQGIELAESKIKSADILLLTLDSSCPPPEISDGLLENFDEKNTIIVLNKSDLPANLQCVKFMENCRRVKICCLDSKGVDELKNRTVELINQYHVRAAADDILVSARHAQWLEEASEFLDKAAGGIESNAPLEIISSDLRAALEAIGEIVGKMDNENILDKIFSNFCIGK